MLCPFVKAAILSKGIAEPDHSMFFMLNNYFFGFCVCSLGFCFGNEVFNKAKLKNGQWVLLKQKAIDDISPETRASK